MGMFICNYCNNLRDSDDGCLEDIRGVNELICNDCTSNGANVCDECWDEIEAGQEFIENDKGLFHKDCIEEEQEVKVYHEFNR